MITGFFHAGVTVKDMDASLRFYRDLLGLTSHVTLVNTADFYDDRYPTGSLVPGVATESFTIIGAGSGPGL